MNRIYSYFIIVIIIIIQIALLNIFEISDWLTSDAYSCNLIFC